VYGIVTLFDALFKGTSDPLPFKVRKRGEKREEKKRLLPSLPLSPQPPSLL
jgi:hypothetical protein